MKQISTLILLLVSIISFSQTKKVHFELTGKLNFSVQPDKLKTYINTQHTFSAQYFSSKKFENPYLNFAGIATYPLTNNIKAGLSSDNIKAGLSSGIYLFFKEEYFTTTKRTFAALPLQAVFDYHTPISQNREMGLRLSPGVLLYHIKDVVFEVNNAFVLDSEVYYQISKQSKVQLGFNLIKEKSNFEFYLSERSQILNSI